ncbi:MAG: hypothetical protein HGB23_09065 [Chlorobiaceae bacterium]|nr:hypothetical protein [Chlorobiaceae bacterium]
MEEQTQTPDIVKNIVGVLMFIPPIGIPVLIAGVGLKVAGFLFNTAGFVVGAAGSQVSKVLGSMCCSGQPCK